MVIFLAEVSNLKLLIIDARPIEIEVENLKVKSVAIPKIQQALDKYNRKLMRQESWGNGAPRSDAISTPRLSRGGTSVERRVQQKIATLDHHLAKEPRERVTVGQKKAIKDKELFINLETITNKFAVGFATARGSESQNRQFLIRTSNSKTRPAGGLDNLAFPDSIITNREGKKPDLSINLSKAKSNSSGMTISKTTRARINN